MPRIAIGDGHLYYERHGSGFPIVMVTGLSGHAQYWRDQLPAFAKSFEIITHDLRGFGESDPPPPLGFTVERLAGDVVGLMDALQIERAHIIGHSAGGAVAQVLAIDHPKRVASIVLSATWAKADAYFRRLFGLRKDILLRMGPAAYVQTNSLLFYPAHYITRNNEKLRQIEAQSLALLASPETIVNRIDTLLAFDRSEDLGRVKAPALVVAAQDDLVTPAYYAEELARRIPGAEVKFFAQGGHYLNHVMAREFNQAVLPFLIAHTPDRAETSR